MRSSRGWRRRRAVGIEDFEEGVDVNRFAEIVSVFAEAFGGDHVVLTGHKEDAGLGIADIQKGGEGVAGDMREVDVEEDGVGRDVGHFAHGFLGVGGGADGVAVGGEETGEGVAGGDFVVDDEE